MGGRGEKDEGIRQKDMSDRFWPGGEGLRLLPLDCEARNIKRRLERVKQQ